MDMVRKKKTKFLNIICLIILLIFILIPVSGVIVYKSAFVSYSYEPAPFPIGIKPYHQVGEKTYTCQEIQYKSNKETLQGYYYKAEESKGIIIFNHGYKSAAEVFFPLFIKLIDNNYSIFAYDGTGVNNSTGKSTIGFCQPLIDLNNTISYVKNSDLIEKNDIYLMGHSMGGYAVCSVLSLQDDIKGVVSLSGVCDAYNLIFDKGKQYIGFLVYLLKPLLNVLQNKDFKEYKDYNSVKGLNDSNVPALIIHGVDDKTILYDKDSIISRKDLITNPNVTYYTQEGLNAAHSNIIYSEESIRYQKEVTKTLKEITKNKDSARFEQYYNEIDHQLYSQIDNEILNQILNFYNSQ